MKLNKKISYTTIGEETLISNTELNKDLILDSIGTEIWNLLLEYKNKSIVKDKLINKYNETDPEFIERDIEEFINELNNYKVFDSVEEFK